MKGYTTKPDKHAQQMKDKQYSTFVQVASKYCLRVQVCTRILRCLRHSQYDVNLMAALNFHFTSQPTPTTWTQISLLKITKALSNKRCSTLRNQLRIQPFRYLNTTRLALPFNSTFYCRRITNCCILSGCSHRHQEIEYSQCELQQKYQATDYYTYQGITIRSLYICELSLALIKKKPLTTGSQIHQCYIKCITICTADCSICKVTGFEKKRSNRKVTPGKTRSRLSSSAKTEFTHCTDSPF